MYAAVVAVYANFGVILEVNDPRNLSAMTVLVMRSTNSLIRRPTHAVRGVGPRGLHKMYVQSRGTDVQLHEYLACRTGGWNLQVSGLIWYM